MTRFFIGVLLGTAAAIAFQQVRRRRRSTQEAPATRPPAPHPSAQHEDALDAEADDLESLTSAELYRRAQAAAIRGRASMTKAQLIEALRAVSE
jgi:hypothetical protein